MDHLIFPPLPCNTYTVIILRWLKDQCSVAEKRIRDMIDEITGAFDSHLEDAAAAAKVHFRWIKRRYREKIDVNRVASKIELKVGTPRRSGRAVGLCWPCITHKKVVPLTLILVP